MMRRIYRRQIKIIYYEEDDNARLLLILYLSFVSVK